MLYEETEDVSISLETNYIVYFLLDKKEVVYVGQSVRNLSRPFQHLRDKVFDEIKAIYLEEDKELLNKTEAYYIAKYKPKYNVALNEDLNKKRIELEDYENSMDAISLNEPESIPDINFGYFFTLEELNFILSINNCPNISKSDFRMLKFFGYKFIDKKVYMDKGKFKNLVSKLSNPKVGESHIKEYGNFSTTVDEILSTIGVNRNE